MTETSDVVLDAEGIVKTFPGVRALDRAALRVRRGRLVALLGENGAGKSTFMNIMAGVFPPDSGSLRLDGREVTFPHPRSALAAGIGVVFQELNLIPDLTVAENIFLGREPRNRWGLIDHARLRAETEAVLQRLELSVSPGARVGELRVGEQQLVEIARAASANVRVLILDEPTSSLSAREVETLFALINDFKRRGVALVYITHKMEELAEIADDVVVMRDGRVVGEGPLHAMDRATIIRLMAGREAGAAFAKTAPGPGAELLRARGLRLPGPSAGRPFLVHDVDMSVRAGEVLGLFGLIGAGRTELLEILFGLHAREAAGDVWIDGERARFRSPADAIAAGVVLAPEDRKRDGLVLEMSVAENASLASLDRASRGSFVSSAREARHVQPYLERFRVKTPSPAQRVRNLSGGNQQKVILAKWLAAGPRILLLDEPTRGIDINAKHEIYAFIDELAASGLAVILASSELPEVLALCDRVMVMCEGRKTAEFSRDVATPERVLHAALPLKAGACGPRG